MEGIRPVAAAKATMLTHPDMASSGTLPGEGQSMVLAKLPPVRSTAALGHAVRYGLVGVIVVALFVLVVLPISWLLYNSFHDDLTGKATIGNYVAIASSWALIQPMLNSLLLGLSVAIIATIVGVPMAWLASRTDMPSRNLIRILMLTIFVTPSFIGATAWILLAAPNSGWINTALRDLFGTHSGVLNIYSLTGAIFVSAIYTVPFTFTLVSTSLDDLAVELEDAATTLGSSTLKTLWSVTIPLVMPAIIAGFILSFVQGVTLFGVPAFLLVPAGIPVVTTRLAEFYQLFPPGLFASAAYCMPLLLVTATMFAIRRRVLGRRQYVMIGGKAGAKRMIALKAWRIPALAFSLLLPFVAVALPYFALVLISLSKSWGKGISLENFSLHWYHWALVANSDAYRSIINSIYYSAAAATFGILLGVAVAYAAERKIVRGTLWLGALASAPIIIPGVVLSVGFFAAYSRPPMNLYGTAAIMILAFTATFLPIAYAQGGNVLKGISHDLEKAALTLGAGEARAFFSITAPLMKTGLIAGWLLIFIPTIRELSVVIFLITPRTNVMTTLIYNAKDGGSYEALCAMSVLLLLTTVAVILLVKAIERATMPAYALNRLGPAR